MQRPQAKCKGPGPNAKALGQMQRPLAKCKIPTKSPLQMNWALEATAAFDFPLYLCFFQARKQTENGCQKAICTPNLNKIGQ